MLEKGELKMAFLWPQEDEFLWRGNLGYFLLAAGAFLLTVRLGP